jgi:Fe-S cluster biogenesis protein NfuA
MNIMGTNEFERFKRIRKEYEETERQFKETVKEWFEKNYKPKIDEDSVIFNGAHLKGDDTISISYSSCSSCNFETMDRFYNGETDDDGKYYNWIEVKSNEIFK